MYWFLYDRDIRHKRTEQIFQETLHFTHFSPMFYFYTPWKRQKTFGFQMFSGGIEMGHWAKLG